jgi:hypothetical protein
LGIPPISLLQVPLLLLGKKKNLFLKMDNPDFIWRMGVGGDGRELDFDPGLDRSCFP